MNNSDSVRAQPHASLGSSHWIPLVLAVTGSIWYLFLVSLGILGCCSARRRYRLRPRSPLSSASPNSVPGVSVLRPLKGLDTNLYENLESTFTQEYPKFELLFSVADEDDQALPIVRELLAKYPTTNARIIIGEGNVGMNPKVNNLIRPYREAAHDILWVMDSNVMAAPGTLARSVDALNGAGKASASPSKRRIGLVHHVPFATSADSLLGARIEEAFLNTNHAKMYLAINSVAVESCVVGKSNMYRRSDLDRVTGSLKPTLSPLVSHLTEQDERGLAAFGRFLAEDNMIAAALWHELGLRHDLSCDVARNAVGKMTFAGYVQRRVRWIRVRKHMVMSATLLEPFTESVVLGLLGAASLHYLTGIPAIGFLAVHFAWWLVVDFDVYASLAGHPLPAASRVAFFLAWAARELLALPIFMLAIFGSEVEWRGRKYRVLRNGEIESASGKKSWLSWRRSQQTAEGYEPLMHS